MTNDNIGERIRQRRKQLHLSQDELAKRTGYKSRSAINKIEMSVNGLPRDKVIIFSHALNTTPVYLMGLVDDPDWKMPLDVVTPKLDIEVQHVADAYTNATEQQKRLVEYILGINEAQK